MVGQDPFEVVMLPGETFGQYLARITIAMTVHMVDPNSPFHDPTIRARCLLNGLSEEEPWSHFRQKYREFMETGEMGDYADYFTANGNPWWCILQELALKDAADETGNPLAWYSNAFPEMVPPEVVPPENPPHPSLAPQPHMAGDPLPEPQLPQGIPIVESESDSVDMWAADDAYDIWGGADADNSGDSSGVVSVVAIAESPEIVVISSGESEEGGDEELGESDGAEADDSWSSGSESSNSSDPDYVPRGRARKGK